jgi:hypothetical protein
MLAAAGDDAGAAEPASTKLDSKLDLPVTGDDILRLAYVDQITSSSDIQSRAVMDEKALEQFIQRGEKAAEKAGMPLPYPTPEELRREAEEEEPTVLLVVSDEEGNVVRTVFGPTSAGMHRVTWDLRDPGAVLPGPASQRRDDDDDDPRPRGSGPVVAPGRYSVRLFQRIDGKVTPLDGPAVFMVLLDSLGNPDPDAVRAQVAFHRQVLKLSRAVTGSTNVANELATRLDAIRRALDLAPKADDAAKAKVREMIAANRDILRALRGDTVLAARNENVPTSISERAGYAARAAGQSLGLPTTTQKEQYDIAAKEFAAELAKLKQISDTDLPALEKKLDAFGAPWTPGRLPTWEK